MDIDYSILPEHCRGGMRRYVEDGLMPGDFLTAVLENNLVEAFARADDINIHRLFDYANFLYNELPISAWGSPEKVERWAARQREKRELMEIGSVFQGTGQSQ